MASLVTACIVLLSTFFLLPALYYLPTCVLGSMYATFPVHVIQIPTCALQHLSSGIVAVCRGPARLGVLLQVGRFIIPNFTKLREPLVGLGHGQI